MTRDEWFIERHPVDKGISRLLDGWKQMLAEGWELTILHDHRAEELVAFGHRPTHEVE